MAEKALKERLKPKRETRKQKEVRQAKRRRWAKAPKCPSVPMWKLKFAKVGEDRNGKDILHEIGRCAHFIRGRCRNTEQPCPFNGIRDFTELQASEGKTSRNIDTIAFYPTHNKLPQSMITPSKRKGTKALSSQASRGRPQDFNPPSNRDYYHAPTRRMLPPDSESWDGLFKALED